MTTKLLHISALWWLMLPPVCEVMGSNPRQLLALGRLAKWSVLSKSEKREKMAKGSINRRLVLQKPLEHDLRPKKKILSGGSQCDTVDRAVASGTRGLRFESTTSASFATTILNCRYTLRKDIITKRMLHLVD